jgi:hypothetical protein
MRRHAGEFSSERIGYFNEMLTFNGKQRYVL